MDGPAEFARGAGGVEHQVPVRIGTGLRQEACPDPLVELGGLGLQAQLEHARKKLSQRIVELEGQKKDIEEAVAELKLGLAMIAHRLSEREEETRPAPRVFGFGVMPAEH